ncbi:MAG: PIN domain-containing protein [Candidatus Micrarchaeota archaeon]
MQILVVDANFLMSAYKFKVDAMGGLYELFPGGFRLVTSNSILEELKGLAKKRSDVGKGAAYSLWVLEKNRAEVISTNEKADDWVVSYCAKNSAIACTNDAELRKRLKSQGIKSIVLKGRSTLDCV